MEKIKVIFTGGTIGSLANGNDISPNADTKYLLLEKYGKNINRFFTSNPLFILSENANLENVKKARLSSKKAKQELEKTKHELEQAQSKVNELEKRNVNLQNVNAKLFNQIGTEVEPQNTKKEPQEEPKKSVSFSSFFDEKGNFKK